jgi:diguanylate cyclase
MVREHDRDLPFIVLSGTIGEERAVQLMKLGAQDYVIKGNTQRLLPAVARELREAKLRREHRLAQAHIQHLAYYDSLTNLPNRHRLIEDLQRHLDEKMPAALLIMNVTNFREINGALGYSKGDELICETAARLREAVSGDTGLYHLHGNEFAMLAETGDHGRVEAIAQSALKVLAPPFLAAGFRIPIRARLGITSTAGSHIDANGMLQSADLASMFARREGKPYAWYQPERDPSHPERLALLADLYDALATDQLSLAFQPKIHCATNNLTGAEALLRWNHPEHGAIPPDSFIGMAEQSGLIDDLTRQVLARTAAQISAWRKDGLQLPIAMNLSAKNLLNADIMSEILHIATRDQGHPAIELEITETALMRDPDRAMKAMQRLYEAGIRIYIDDFGTGFSSLGYLKRLPIHAVKIDKSFVMDMVHNPDSDAIVRSTISLAHNLGLKIVAEGVENRETWERLQRYECDEGQGYLFSRPLPSGDFFDQVGKWKRS